MRRNFADPSQCKCQHIYNVHPVLFATYFITAYALLALTKFKKNYFQTEKETVIGEEIPKVL